MWELAQNSPQIKLPAPNQDKPAQQPAAKTEQTQVPSAPLGPWHDYRMPSDTAIIAGAVLLLFVFGIGFLGKWAMTSHLLDKYASPDAATRTGWVCCLFIILSLATIIVGWLGNLFVFLEFGLIMGALVLVTLIVLLVFYRSAKQHRR